MITFDHDETTGSISVLTQTEAGGHREALLPGEFDRARELLPDDLYAEVEALWTPEVIEGWKAAHPVEETPEPLSEDFKPLPTMSNIQNQLTQLQLAVINLGSDDSAIHASLVDKGEILLSDVPKMIRSEVQSTLNAKNLFNA